MNIFFFKYAIEIERTRSITKAAENLSMARPNLSKAIGEMEPGKFWRRWNEVSLYIGGCFKMSNLETGISS
jgi:hypothetical protein